MGIFWEIADPGWRVRFLKEFCCRVWVENQKDKGKKIFWRRKDRDPIDVYPWKETGLVEPVKPPLEATKNAQGNGKTVEATEKPQRQYTQEEKDIIQIASLCEDLGVTKRGMGKEGERKARIAFLRSEGYEIESTKDLDPEIRNGLIAHLKTLLNAKNGANDAA